MEQSMSVWTMWQECALRICLWGQCEFLQEVLLNTDCTNRLCESTVSCHISLVLHQVANVDGRSGYCRRWVRDCCNPLCSHLVRSQMVENIVGVCSQSD